MKIASYAKSVRIKAEVRASIASFGICITEVPWPVGLKQSGEVGEEVRKMGLS